MRCRGVGIRNERGSTIALIAVCLFAMLALAALATDLANLRDARSEAQRVADAIALAGASAFQEIPIPADAVDEAQRRALLYARRNRVRQDTIDIRPAVWDGTEAVTVPGSAIVDKKYNITIPVRTVTTNEVTLNIISDPDSLKVRAWVHRSGTLTFFAGLLARPYGHVTAMATAWAAKNAPTVTCLKPFLIPDMWHEANKTTQDKNTNDYMEPGGTSKKDNGEQWLYEPPAVGGSDYYIRYDPDNLDPQGRAQTGYGSGRTGYTGDYGLPLMLKPQTGTNQRQGNSYFTLDGPLQNLRDNIKTGCINASVGDVANIDDSPGGQTGQARQGIQYLYDQDPSATWNPTTRQVDNTDPKFGHWTNSPRVILVGLMDPKFIQGTSKNTKPDPNATFDNFARLFIKDAPSPNQGEGDNISAIFIGFAPGGPGGEVAGTLVKQLQLIE